jgi:hypothetical protein
MQEFDFDRLLSQAADNFDLVKPGNPGKSDIFLVTVEGKLMFLTRLFEERLYCLPVAACPPEHFSSVWITAHELTEMHAREVYVEVCENYFETDFMDTSVLMDWSTPAGDIFDIKPDELLTLGEAAGKTVAPAALKPLLVLQEPSEIALLYLKEGRHSPNGKGQFWVQQLSSGKD